MTKLNDDPKPVAVVPVYDIQNAGPRHRFVANGKLIHNSDGINLQNLPSGRKEGQTNALRRAIKAPDGMVTVAGDSGQIEARVLAWLANQTDLLEEFANDADPYSIMAAEIFGGDPAEIRRLDKEGVEPYCSIQRPAGKATVLGAGYGLGKKKFGTFAKTSYGVNLTDEQAELAIVTYRRKNAHIVRSWKRAQEVLDHMAVGGQGYFLGPNEDAVYYDGSRVLFGEVVPSIRLPSGTWMTYPGLRIQLDDEGKRSVVFDTMRGRSKVKTYIYGGKFIENCIAENTLVLTDSGWKKIQDIQLSDKVHDGDRFVTHGGILNKSEQDCVTVDGVFMTPDHEVLNEHQKWQSASQQPRPYRPEIRNADMCIKASHDGFEVGVGVPMRLWQKVREVGRRCHERSTARRNSELWMYDESVAVKTENPRHVKASGIRSLAKHVRSLPTAVSPSMEKLWRAGDHGMRVVADGIRIVLGRYGVVVPAGYGLESRRQQRGILTGKLSLDNAKAKLFGQTKQHWFGRDVVKSTVGCSEQYDSLSVGTRTGRFRVYDILNCGPKTRFVVQGDRGPMIVHNCTQAIAFDIMKHQGIWMMDLGVEPKLNTHDEFAAVVHAASGQATKDLMVDCMTSCPDWIQGLPLKCDAKFAERYGDC